MIVNHRWVARMIGTKNLLTIRRRELPGGQQTGPMRWKVNLNPASRLKVGRPNQVWIRDITYIRVQTEFVYLLLVLDVFSCRAAYQEMERESPSGLILMAISTKKYSVESRRK